ncbi:MAG: GtrA family protein [Bacilli bacterium]|nr:GtrA family protein [Bacilli bacterium]
MIKFLKYIISALISFLIDIGIFAILSKVLGFVIGDLAIVVGTIIARIISSLVNYSLNKNKVFEHKNDSKVDKESLVKYYLLVIIQMSVSALSVWIIHKVTNINATTIKIIVDGIIFVINYIIQKNFIFKK